MKALKKWISEIANPRNWTPVAFLGSFGCALRIKKILMILINEKNNDDNDGDSN